MPYLREHFGNPSSTHAYGRRRQEAVEQARGGRGPDRGRPEEIVFTGCATEANNLAILGVAGRCGSAADTSSPVPSSIRRSPGPWSTCGGGAGR